MDTQNDEKVWREIRQAFFIPVSSESGGHACRGAFVLQSCTKCSKPDRLFSKGLKVS